jgi:hypothetical protein
VDALFKGNRVAMSVVPLLLELYNGVSLNINGGLIVAGDYDGGLIFAYSNNGEVKRLPFCKKDDDSLCGTGFVSSPSWIVINWATCGTVSFAGINGAAGSLGRRGWSQAGGVGRKGY